MRTRETRIARTARRHYSCGNMGTRAEDFQRSKRRKTLPVRASGALRETSSQFFDAEDATARQAAGQSLLVGVCQRLEIESPTLHVLDAPRPHRVRDGRLSYERLGSYSLRTKTIKMHNRTAIRQQIVAPRTAFETLVHELVHHVDFWHLGLSRSLHTSGFYHRIGFIKRTLVGG